MDPHFLIAILLVLIRALVPVKSIYSHDEAQNRLVPEQQSQRVELITVAIQLAKGEVRSSTLSLCPNSWVALNLVRVIAGWAERVHVCDISERIELK